jgi:hypothetical protein
LASSKDTKRERRDEAKKARLEAQRRAKRRSAMRKVYGGVAAVLIVGLIAFLIINGGKEGRDAKASLVSDATAAQCDAPKTNPEMPSSKHITRPATATYNANPPTSGEHYADGPAGSAYFTGVHTNPFQDEEQVHNLEHGHVGIQYTDALPETVRTALEEFVGKHDTTAFIAPRPSMTTAALAFTAWNQVVTCTAPTDAAAVVKLAEDFYKAFADKAPESVPGAPLK